VFQRSCESWAQQAYVKASNTGTDDRFGFSVALSGSGNTLAATAYWEDSGAMGVDGEQTDNSVVDSGAVYVFQRSGASWAQQAYIKASNTGAGDVFGISVAVSESGDTLAVGANAEDSGAVGVDGDQADNSAVDSGAVYVFQRSGASWAQQAYVKASNTGANDWFGVRVALSGSGDTLAVSAQSEASRATGVGGDQADNSASQSGAVYLFH
jgi:trimeric autotransporter adhesin